MENVEITGIACDSRKVLPGYIFVAIRGEQTNGEKYARQAVEKGAVMVVAQRRLAVGVPCVCTDHPRRVLAKLAARFRNNPAEKLHIIGVTGTNGKTTVTYLIESIINKWGHKTGLIGTNEITACGKRLSVTSTTPTTPDAVELHQIFAEFVRLGVEYVVMEVSSHALELERVWGIRYAVGVFTNLTQDHLDFHQTMDRYFAAKAKLFSISDCGVVNTDDKWGQKIVQRQDCPVLTTGLQDANVMAGNVQVSAKGTQFVVAERGMRYPIRVSLPGRFNVYNALSAIGACASLGVPREVIRSGLLNVKGVCGRLEVVPTNTDYTVIIDYAHSPDGLEKVLNAIRDFVQGRIIAVFGCGGDRDRSKRPQMGRIAENLSDIVIVTSDNPRTEEPEAIIRDILAGMEDCRNCIVIPDRTMAIRRALATAKQGDVVLLVGKGQETYQILGKEKIDFDERKIVRQILNE